MNEWMNEETYKWASILFFFAFISYVWQLVLYFLYWLISKQPIERAEINEIEKLSICSVSGYIKEAKRLQELHEKEKQVAKIFTSY